MKKIALIFSIFLIITACSKQQQAKDEIKKLEEKVFVDTLKSTVNSAVCEDLLKQYKAYADQYPTDSLSAGYLLKGGQISMAANQPHRAIEFYTSLVNGYPSWHRTNEALFLKAFIYENTIKDMSKAKQSYLQLIQNYPNSEFADDAQACVNMLGKSLDEIIDAFESGDTTALIQ